MDGVRKHLLRKSQPEHLVFVGEKRATGEFYPKMVSIPQLQIVSLIMYSAEFPGLFHLYFFVNKIYKMQEKAELASHSCHVQTSHISGHQPFP